MLPKEFSFRKLFEAFLRNVDFGLNVRSVKYSEFSEFRVLIKRVAKNSFIHTSNLASNKKLLATFPLKVTGHIAIIFTMSILYM